MNLPNHGEASTSSSKPSFSLDKLVLSAQIFSADVESWIPESFGPRKSEAQRQAEFDKAIQEASLKANDTLGLGHPDAGKGKGKSVLGLDALRRRAGKLPQGKSNTDSGPGQVRPNGDGSVVDRPGGMSDTDDEDASESRATIGKGKKRAGHVDLMAPKKKLKAVSSTNSVAPLVPASSDPLLLRAPASDRMDRGGETETATQINPYTPSPQPEHHHDAEEVDDKERFPFSGPISLESPQARRILAEGSKPFPSPKRALSKLTNSTNGFDPTDESAEQPTFPSSQELAGSQAFEAVDSKQDDLAPDEATSNVQMTKNQRKNARKKEARKRKQGIHNDG